MLISKILSTAGIFFILSFVDGVLIHNLTMIPSTYQKYAIQEKSAVLPIQHLLTRIKRQEFDADVPEEPPDPCDFGVGGPNLDMCTWLIPAVTTIRSRWRLGMGELSAWIGGPRADHTTSDRQGGYVFYETSFQEDSHLPVVPTIVKQDHQVVGGARPLPQGAGGSSVDPDDDFGVIDSALFISRNLSKTGPMGYCLSFFYIMEGLSADRLIIHLKDMETAENASLWEIREGVEGSWTKGEVAYTYDGNHLIVFEAVTKATNDPARPFRGYIALDDMVFQKMGSPDLDNCFGHCTFEGGFCGWTNDVEDDFDWELGRSSKSFLTGPSRDFSSYNRDEQTGGYSYIDASFPRRPGDRARLLSPNFLATGDNNPVCMKFATHMFGNGVGSLRVLKRVPGDEAPDRVLWEISGESGNKWYRAQVSVSSATSYQLVFEGVVGTNSLGNIAIDSVSFIPGTCTITPQTAAKNSGDCTFEEDACGWTNALPIDALDDFDWARQYSYSVSGPSTDHTKGTKEGYYMNLLSNPHAPQRGGTRAWLISPLFSATGRTRCLSFYYFMYERSIDPAGPSLGSLRIHVRSAAGEAGGKVTTLWRLHNHQGQRWQTSRTPVVMGSERAAPSSPYQIIIEGIWGDGRVGVIAIDDISFFDGDCSSHPLKATAVIGECSFDRNMCDWKNNTESPPPLQELGSHRATSKFNRHDLQSQEGLTWRLASIISRPANLQDHTFRAPTGYVFFDIFNQASAQNPVLRSPDFAASQNDALCLSFWFAPFGRGEATALSIMRVELAPPEGEKEQRLLIWKMATKKFDTSRPDWMYGQVSVATLTAFRVEFEGEATDGGFALDDVTFYDGNCQTRPEVAAVEPPPSEKF
ncbi:MAM and LDL-receptor class A domain-containing protein 1 [Parasteatoda tepidariorum]|nr:MAM and LDL-receptor class A domain-containing protein 1 [Parasteatoda tepidariorum]